MVSWVAAVIVASSLAMVMPAFAQTSGGANAQGGSRDGANGGMQHEGIAPGVFGSVTAISGTTLTVTSEGRSPRQGTSSTVSATDASSTVYTVDASDAKVYKDNATTAVSVSTVAVGDSVMVEGTVSGANVTATVIRDGVAKQGGPSMPGGDHKFAGASSTRPTSSSTPEIAIKGNGEPVVGGDVTAISGTTLTITNTSNVTYTIDAASATVVVKGASSTLGNVAVGDTLVVQGTVNGTSVTASSIIDQGIKPTNASSTNSSSSQPRDGGGFGGFGGAIGGFFGSIGGFFQHLFGF